MLLLAACARAGDDSVAEPARPADNLVAGVGVATHFGFHNTVYHQSWDIVQQRLGELGMRHVRDGLDPHLQDLRKRYGVQAILVTDPTHTWEQWAALWHTNLDVITAIEGPNEANGGWLKLGSHGVYEGKGWPDGVRLFQNDLYRHVKDDPLLKDIPVIAVSTAYKGAGRELVPCRAFDVANIHSYAGGGMPSTSFDFRDPYLLLGPGARLPPLAATESGYHTCLGLSKVIAGAQQGISHAAHRKYIPRHVAACFNAGYVWTVIYEFAAGRPKKNEQEDPEAAFGLLMPDATPKPAYFALKELLALVGESKWDATAGKWQRPTPAQPRALTFALRGAPASVQHMLLQRADSTFQLLIWNEVSCFDLAHKRDITNPDVPVELVLTEPARAVTVTRLGPDAPPPVVMPAGKSFALSVPDEVVVVGIALANPSRPATLAPPPPADVQSTATSVALLWPTVPAATTYWVSINNRQIGCATQGPDGKLRFRAGGLLPATTYPFEIVAAARDGGVSAPVAIAAATVDAFPDLIVKSLRVVPESPQEGDVLHFEAGIENVGKAPTEDGVTIGTKFSVDGKTVCWCDNVRGPLAPGQPLTIRANSGPAGAATWIMTRGSHQITAMVDDINRIIESNENNNRLSITVSNGAGPDLLFGGVNVHASRASEPLVVDVTITNQGNDAVAPGTRISTSVYSTDVKPRKNLGYAINLAGLPAGSALSQTVTCPPALTAGKHTIAVVVDDVNRIPELNKSNNTTNLEIEVGAAAAGVLPNVAPTVPLAAQTAPTVAAPADVASVMHPTGERHLRTIHARFMQRIQQDNKIQLLFLGDSITAGWASATDVWQQAFYRYDPANFGDSGSYTQHLLWRIENGELDDISPKVVVLLVGINNLYHNPGNTPEETAAGIRKIISTIHQKLPETKVLLMGIFPYREKESGPRKAAAAVNAIIAKFDDGQKTRYLGLWNEFLQPDGSISREIMKDGLHPTPKGYEIWATHMKTLLDEMMK